MQKKIKVEILTAENADALTKAINEKLGTIPAKDFVDLQYATKQYSGGDTFSAMLLYRA